MSIPVGSRRRYRCDVIIPYHAGLQWLPQAIESILSQQSTECFLHLVNDASPEDDRWVRRRYATQGNIFWYRNRESIGPYRSVHGVWDHLQTPFFAVQDADDISLPTRLWRAIHALEATGCEIYGGAMEQFLDWNLARDPAHVAYLDGRPFLRSGEAHLRVPEGGLVNATMVCRNSTFEKLNGFGDFFCGADTEFTARAHLAGIRLFFDDTIVALRRIHDHSLSRCSEHAVGSGSERQRVSAAIKRARRLSRTPGRVAAWDELGALVRHRRAGTTARLPAPPTAGQKPLSEVLRCLIPVRARTSAYGYLQREGFAEADARKIPAVLPLMRFPDFDAYLAKVGKNVRRDARLSARQGHYCRAFAPENHAPDMIEIANSKSHRQGRPMRETVSECFAPGEREPKVSCEVEAIRTPHVFTRYFGLFEPRPGYLQGSLEVNEKLLAFIQVTRKDDMAFYTRILGHGDHLWRGIMFALHLHVMQWLLARQDDTTVGIQLLMYSSWDGVRESMRFWKRRAGLVPACIYDADRIATGPEVRDDLPFPRQVLAHARSAAAFFCAAFGGRNDVVHYDRAGIRDVHLIDQDFSKLATLQQQYPAEWTYRLGDAFAAANEYAGERTFDIVSCDAWSAQFELVADRHFSRFYDLAKQFLLLTVVPGWAEGKGYGPEWFQSNCLDYSYYIRVRDAFATGGDIRQQLGTILSQRRQANLAVVDVVRRTDYLGGCYWIVVRKQESPP